MTYLPPHFREDDPDRIAALIEAHPLATLVATGTDGLQAHHIPLLLIRHGGDHGTLVGHVARNNDRWVSAEGSDVLAIFQTADAYITPNWYPSKGETHEVVPTWNYAVVHDDEKWTRGVVGRLTQAMERSSPVPWKMGDAPQEYLREMLGNIVGIEIPVRRIVGKWKASQNRSAADRSGVIDGLLERSRGNDVRFARVMQDLDT